MCECIFGRFPPAKRGFQQLDLASLPENFNQRWAVGNTVLIGDALHTAHFSSVSGIWPAMEDAIALAEAHPTSGRYPPRLVL